MEDQYKVDETNGPPLEDIAKTMYDDFETFADRDDYGWKGGTLRPTDYDSEESVFRALKMWAPFPQHQEAEALFGDQDSGTHANFSYNVRHVKPNQP